MYEIFCECMLRLPPNAKTQKSFQIICCCVSSFSSFFCILIGYSPVGLLTASLQIFSWNFPSFVLYRFIQCWKVSELAERSCIHPTILWIFNCVTCHIQWTTDDLDALKRKRQSDSCSMRKQHTARFTSLTKIFHLFLHLKNINLPKKLTKL